jgi:hypothetical protein
LEEEVRVSRVTVVAVSKSDRVKRDEEGRLIWVWRGDEGEAQSILVSPHSKKVCCCAAVLMLCVVSWTAVYIRYIMFLTIEALYLPSITTALSPSSTQISSFDQSSSHRLLPPSPRSSRPRSYLSTRRWCESRSWRRMGRIT